MDPRTSAQIKEHYEIEKEIAARLRNSDRLERTTLYTWAYDELFQRVPHHPLLAKEFDDDRRAAIKKEIEVMKRFITENTVYLEVGPGDCGVSLEIAKRAKKVFAIDVSREITQHKNAPSNFELLLSDGTSIPVSSESIDLTYSNQLMEHLHPDDSLLQLRNIYRSLKPGGIYFCVTPNRLSGPHDVSRDFDAVATGLHLKEYTVTELDTVFRQTGFSRTRIYVRVGTIEILLPTFPYKIIEVVLNALPHSIRKLITFNRAVRFLLGIKLVGTK